MQKSMKPTKAGRTGKQKSSATGSPGSAANQPPDYVAVAVEYACQAVADKDGKAFGQLIRLAAARFLDDLKRAKADKASFIFDPWHACDACGFIECLPHVEGQWATANIRLEPAQIFFIVQLFGFRKAGHMQIDGWEPDGKFHPRRFTSALLAVSRKNAKSTIAAGILLYCQCCEPEPGAQVISAATTFQQSRVIFDIAKRMVEKTHDLQRAYRLQVFSKAVARLEHGSTFKPINAKASTQDGLNPSHIALDEIHAHKTSDLLNVLTSAAGARSNPLWLYTTTEGYLNPGPWGELRQFARQLLEGVFGQTADHFLAVFYAIDPGDNELDEKVWGKANPLLATNPHLLAAIRRDAVEARAMPSKMAEFRIKRLNRQSAHGDAWVNLERWKACKGVVDLEKLRGQPCVGALDLSSTSDLASWRLVWKIDGVWVTWGRRWVPQEAIRARTERGTVPYAGWVESGLMTQTPGNVVDYEVIEKTVLEDFARFRPSKIAYDRWNATDLVNRLVNALPQDTMIEFIQGPKSYHPAMQEFERAYISGNVAHGDDPVLTWCMSNLVVRRDVNMNMAPDKKKAPDKIDDACTLLMGIGASLITEPKRKYQVFIV